MAIGALSSVAAVTKQQQVYRTVREAILRCELRPGARLVIDDLAQRFEMSIIPVREALRLLEAEGLVVTIAHVGATVAPISHDSVVEVFTILEGLELVATRAAAERSGDADLAALSDMVVAMDRAIDGGAPGAWAGLNTRFHLAIAEIAGMPLLQEMLRRAFDRWDRVRRYYFRDVLVRRTRIAQAEHREIVALIRARDLARLEEIVRAHNRGALAAYTACLGSPAIGDRGPASEIHNLRSAIHNPDPEPLTGDSRPGTRDAGPRPGTRDEGPGTRD
jgi:DNA-binding GntR family transcriptional regulator